MATQIDFLASLLLGILPALGLLWLSLRGYDRPRFDHTLFDDRRVFGNLAAGMVFGVFASVLSLLTPRADLASFLLGLVAAFALEETFKVVMLNRKSYRGRFDTTFYGIPLGVGTASTAVVASAYWNAAYFGNLFVPEILAGLALFSVSLNLVHVGSGAIIAFGASRGETWGPLARSLLVRVAHGLLLVPFFLSAPNPWSLLSVAGSIVFSLVVYEYVRQVLLPGTLPEELARKGRRARRRTRRLTDRG